MVRFRLIESERKTRPPLQPPLLCLFQSTPEAVSNLRAVQPVFLLTIHAGGFRFDYRGQSGLLAAIPCP